jgi:uncharacterized protein YraI
MTQPAIPALVVSFCLSAGPALADAARVTATNANLRSAPGANSRVVATLARGALLEVLDVSGDWVKVRVAETKAEGWVHRRLVDMPAGARPAAPAAARPPAPAAPAPVAPAAATAVTIDHRDVGCVVAGQYPKLEACFRPGANVGRGRVLFRAAGTDPWYYVEMSQDGTCHSAILPKPKPDLKGFEYFVDVIDKSFVEAYKPERAPDQAFNPRVVKKEGDCEPTRKLALAFAKLVKPVVVGVARDPSGGILNAAAAKLLESKALLAGFSSDGVIVSSTGAAPGASAGSTAGSTSAGGAAGGGGLPTIAIVGGVVGAGALVAIVAAGGGGGGSGGGGSGGGSGGGGSGGTSPQGGQVSGVAGQWLGRTANGGGLLFQFSAEGISCSSRYDITANLTQSGSSVGGNMSYSGRTFTCSSPDPELQKIIDQTLAGLPGDSGTLPVGGTATDTAVNMTVSTITFTGSYTRTNMDLTGNFSAPELTYTMTLKLVRQ